MLSINAYSISNELNSVTEKKNFPVCLKWLHIYDNKICVETKDKKKKICE